LDNNKFQELVLEQFSQLNKKIDGVDFKLEKVDSRLGTMDSKLDKVDSGLDTMGSRLDKVSASQVRMENELTEKIRGLYDFMEVQNEVNEHIINSLDRLEAKIDVLQMETANIRRVK
jgi:septal ring factor EnvC (AmiA/AmiB activator)